MKFPTKSLTVFLKVFLLGIFLLPVRWVPGYDDARPLPEIVIPNSPRVPVPPFLNVQIDGAYYSGILIDSSGYIFVERKDPLPWDRYSFVQMEENRRISSQFIFSKEGLRHSWYRVHPDAVKNIRPYPWASPDPDGQVVSVGESVMVQCPVWGKGTLESATGNTEPFCFYGLNDGAEEAWIEAGEDTITWENAPGNDIYSSTEIDTTTTTSLEGTFSVLGGLAPGPEVTSTTPGRPVARA